MSASKIVYSLIAKRQANSVDALCIATGRPVRKMRSTIDHLMRMGLVVRDAGLRPGTYSVTFGSEPPKRCGRPVSRANFVEATIRTQPNSVFALGPYELRRLPAMEPKGLVAAPLRLRKLQGRQERCDSRWRSLLGFPRMPHRQV